MFKNKLLKKITSIAATLAVSSVSFLSLSPALVVPVSANTGAKLELTNTVDKAIADRGDTLAYTIVLKNTGSIATTFTHLWINPLNLADYVAGSSTYVFTPTPNIVRNLTDAWITDGVNFGTMNSGETMTLHYQTKVAANANPNDLIFSVSAADSDQTNKIQAESETKMVFLSTALCANKSADKSTVSVGDTVTFTIKICNNSNINLTDILVKDVINAPFQYVPGSTVLYVGGKILPVADSWLQTQLNIGNLPAGTEASVVFKVTVVGPLTDGQVLKNVGHVSAKELDYGLDCEVFLKGKVLGIVTPPTEKPKVPELPNTGPGEALLLVSALAPAGWLVKKFKSKIK